jgi:formyltetrahydrofolate deformylase
MQILTPRFPRRGEAPSSISTTRFCGVHRCRTVRQAKEVGAKPVGAMAHHVTANLDDGPVFEPDIVRVDHRHSVDDLTRLDVDVERAVLSRAVLWHL